MNRTLLKISVPMIYSLLGYISSFKNYHGGGCPVPTPSLILQVCNYNRGKNIRRLFKNSDKFLKTSKKIIYFSYFSG